MQRQIPRGAKADSPAAPIPGDLDRSGVRIVYLNYTILLTHSADPAIFACVGWNAP